MDPAQWQNHEISVLMNEYIRGTLSEEDAKQLVSELETHPEWVDLLLDNLWVDQWLCERFSIMDTESDETAGEDLKVSLPDSSPDNLDELVQWEKSVIPLAKPNNDSPQSKAIPKTLLQKVLYYQREFWKDPITPIAVIISVFVLGLTALFSFFEGGDNQWDPDLNFNSIVRVTNTIKTVWSEGTPQYKPGQLVDESRFSLVSGMVLLKMNNGTSLILEGPADLTVKSPKSVFCTVGKISVTVPKKGRGFEINTPFGSVIDQGTEFFLDVGREKAQLEVHRGRVDFSRFQLPSIPFLTGKGMEINQDQIITHKTIVHPQGISLDSFRSIFANYENQLFQKQEEQRKDWMNDFDLIACYEGNGKRRGDFLVNMVQDQALRATDLKMKNCRIRTGSLNQTKAFELRHSESMATFTLPLEYESMTFMTTILIPPHEPRGQTIYAGTFYLQQKGSCLWRILQTGEVGFYLTDRNKQQISFKTEPVLSRKDRGTWVQLVVVLDGKKQLISFYKDGEMISSQRWNDYLKLVPGEGIIGNIDNQSIGFTHQNFTGAFESFLVWKRPLTSEEIKAFQQ